MEKFKNLDPYFLGEFSEIPCSRTDKLQWRYYLTKIIEYIRTLLY